ncbi:hypothetical protein OROMI_006795 [Orobanche minor]
MTMFQRFSRTFRENPSLAKMLILARVESHYHRMPYGEILKQGCTIDDAELHSFTVRHASHCETRRILDWAYKQPGSHVIQIQQVKMGDAKENDAYEEELLDYDEEEEKAPESVIAKVNGESVKKGYIGIHSSGFRDFLLKPELLRAIVDSDKEGISGDLGVSQPVATAPGQASNGSHVSK